MRTFKIYFCVILFIAVAAVKILLPDYTERMREQVNGLIDRGDSYSDRIETLGRNLADMGIREGMIEAFGLELKPMGEETEEDTETPESLEPEGAEEDNPMNSTITERV